MSRAQRKEQFPAEPSDIERIRYLIKWMSMQFDGPIKEEE
jgi:hypothetical protein